MPSQGYSPLTSPIQTTGLPSQNSTPSLSMTIGVTRHAVAIVPEGGAIAGKAPEKFCYPLAINDAQTVAVNLAKGL